MKSALNLVVVTLLCPSDGKRHPTHSNADDKDTLDGTPANLTVFPLVAFEDINFAPVTEWKGSMGLGVAYRVYRAIPSAVGQDETFSISCLMPAWFNYGKNRYG